MQYNYKYLKGALWFVLSLLVSSSGDVLMKYLGSSVHPYQVVFLRFLFATILLTPWLYIKRSSFVTKRISLHFIRGALLFCGISFWCMGLNVVKISLATTINFTIPIFVAILAVIFLKEKFNIFRLSATLLGFVGIILAMNPASSDFNMISLALLISAFMFASLDVINKKFVTDESTMSMLFYSNVFTTLLSFIPAMYVWVSITWQDLFMFILLGLVANLILYCLLKSFEIVDASSVAPYRYVELIFSASLGYIFFGEIIDSHIVSGAIIIIIATLFVLYEGLLKKKIRT
jgi:S-adenosylmethionine uptake transporter